MYFLYEGTYEIKKIYIRMQEACIRVQEEFVRCIWGRNPETKLKGHKKKSNYCAIQLIYFFYKYILKY